MISFAPMFAAMPKGYMDAQQQQQQTANEGERQRLLQQQYERAQYDLQRSQQQAPLQDRLLRAQIAHMQQPNVGQQQLQDTRAQDALIYQMMLSPQAQPMPQPPGQGASQPQMPPQQAQQPMPSSIATGMPSAVQPQVPPQQAQQPMPSSIATGVPSVTQAPQPSPQQPQQGPVPQAQPMPQPMDPFEAGYQQGLQQLQQKFSALPPPRSQQEMAQRGAAFVQLQGQLMKQRDMARQAAQYQLQERQQQSLEDWRRAQGRRADRRLTDQEAARIVAGARQEAAEAGRNARAAGRDITAQETAELNFYRNDITLSIEQRKTLEAEVKQKYDAIREAVKPPGGKGNKASNEPTQPKSPSNPHGIPDDDYEELE